LLNKCVMMFTTANVGGFMDGDSECGLSRARSLS